MMHKAAKQLAGPQQAGVLSFCVCVCAMLMGREETKEKKTRPLGCFFWSLSGTNERIHYEEENHNNLHKEAQAALDPTKEF